MNIALCYTKRYSTGQMHLFLLSLYQLAGVARKLFLTISTLLCRQCRAHRRAPRGVTIVASAGVSEVFSQIADRVLAVPPTAYGALGAIGLLGAALFVADPEKR